MGEFRSFELCCRPLAALGGAFLFACTPIGWRFTRTSSQGFPQPVTALGVSFRWLSSRPLLRSPFSTGRVPFRSALDWAFHSANDWAAERISDARPSPVVFTPSTSFIGQ